MLSTCMIRINFFVRHNLSASTVLMRFVFVLRSTVSASADVMDYAHRTVDSQHNVGMVVCVPAKAFDV